LAQGLALQEVFTIGSASFQSRIYTVTPTQLDNYGIKLRDN